jgi:nucleotide-binding universal stress UspA family protein
MVEVILVPTDGSEHAAKAVKLAADLAQKYGARMIALHVMSPSWGRRIPEEMRSYAHNENIEATEREILETVGQQILRSADAAAREEGLEQIDTMLEYGDVPATVLSVAEAQNADFIVMGSRGLGDMKGLLLGSVSHKVTSHSPCTCITVK